MAIGRQDYQERKERKIDAFTAKAQKNSTLASTELNRASDMGSVIPLGQPILVGHHSEKAHRSLLKRIDGAHRRANEAGNKAAYYQDRAETAETNQSISGDDTEAASRYRQKLEQLEAAQEHMKAVNKAWKQGNNALYELGLTDTDIEKLKHKMSSYEKKPFPTWALSNNSAEIRRVKEKLEELNKLDKMEAGSTKFTGGEMLINLEINRIQFIFDDIPSPEIRKLLKSHGFKWAPTEQAWQRQRTLNAINAANYIIKKHFIT
jgi:hypothetical protein